MSISPLINHLPRRQKPVDITTPKPPVQLKTPEQPAPPAIDPADPMAIVLGAIEGMKKEVKADIGKISDRVDNIEQGQTKISQQQQETIDPHSVANTIGKVTRYRIKKVGFGSPKKPAGTKNASNSTVNNFKMNNRGPQFNQFSVQHFSYRPNSMFTFATREEARAQIQKGIDAGNISESDARSLLKISEYEELVEIPKDGPSEDVMKLMDEEEQLSADELLDLVSTEQQHEEDKALV